MVDRPPIPANVRQNYDRIAARYSAMYEGEGPLPHFYQTRLQLVSQLLQEEPRGMLLDLGSGPCILADQARAMGFRYVAADSSFGMARECRRRDPRTSASAVATAEALPFADCSFDVVTALGVFEYVEPLNGAFLECRRVLRPNGGLIVSLLNKVSPYRVVQRARRRIGVDFDRIPAVHFTRRRARRLLTHAGFGVASVTGFDMELLPPGFVGQHPGAWKRMIRFTEPLSRTPLGRLGSAMLIHAHRD